MIEATLAMSNAHCSLTSFLSTMVEWIAISEFNNDLNISIGIKAHRIKPRSRNHDDEVATLSSQDYFKLQASSSKLKSKNINATQPEAT